MTKETAKKGRAGKNATARKKRPAAAKKKTVRAKRKKTWGQVQCTFFVLGVTLLLSLFVGMTLYLFILLDIPNIKSVRDYQPKTATLIVDRHHRDIKRIYEENRRIVDLSEMPGLLPKAFVAAEDARFYEHPGVDVWSIFRALFHNIRAGARAHGGSTITQQVTRSLLLSRKKLYSRKLKEAILSYRIDSVMSKDDIIFIYLNQIFLGENSYGVEAAARTYFNRKVKNLTLGQMALLAGLPQAPSRYSPFRNLELARKRQVYVLNRMAEEGYITPEEARRAYDSPLGLESRKRDSSDVEYYTQYVTNYIRNRYGQEILAGGGLTVYTAMDREIQQAASSSVSKGLKDIFPDVESRPQAAMVVIEAATGRVRALVGGEDFSVSQFDRATQARRQPGSAFKPIVFAAALEKGFTPGSILVDEPLTLSGSRRGESWQPRNFDNSYNGPTSLADGLVQSRNIIAIRLLQETGVDRVVSMARDLGIDSGIKPDLTLALGSSEVSLLEMTGAYTPFINNGRYTPPLLIERIVDRDGNILEKSTSSKTRAMSERTASEMDRMLQGVIQKGTGRQAQGLQGRSGGKTGTTDRYMDAWFIGYNDDFVTGVWVGHDRKETLGDGASGGRVAAPIWLELMKRLE